MKLEDACLSRVSGLYADASHQDSEARNAIDGSTGCARTAEPVDPADYPGATIIALWGGSGSDGAEDPVLTGQTPRWPLLRLGIDPRAVARRARRRVLMQLTSIVFMASTLLGLASLSPVAGGIVLAVGMLILGGASMVPSVRLALESSGLRSLREQASQERSQLLCQMSTAHREDLESLEEMVECVRSFRDKNENFFGEQLGLRLDFALASYVDVAIRHRRTERAFALVEREAGIGVAGERTALAATETDASRCRSGFARRRREIIETRVRARKDCRMHLQTANDYLETLSELIRLAYERALARSLVAEELIEELDEVAEDLQIADEVESASFDLSARAGRSRPRVRSPLLPGPDPSLAPPAYGRSGSKS